MSKENVKLFFEKVSTDAHLQKQLDELVENGGKDVIEKIIQLATENELQFSLKDLKAFQEELFAEMANHNEIAEEALEDVSGGYRNEARITVYNEFEEFLKKLRLETNNPNVDNRMFN